FPRVAAVARHVQAAAGPAAGEFPGLTPRLPETGEEYARIRWIETDIRSPGVRILVKDLLPGLAAVRCSIDPAFGIRSKRMAQHGGVSDVRVARVYDHGADLAFLLPDVLPGFAGVG